MTELHITINLPELIVCIIALLVLVGASLALVGTWGLVKLESFYERVHAPTLGATMGAGCILLAAIIYFSVIEERLFLYPVLIGSFMLVTMPVTLIALVRATLYRDRTDGIKNVPLDE